LPAPRDQQFPAQNHKAAAGNAFQAFFRAGDQHINVVTAHVQWHGAEGR
jgi:hypothetical protein